jgi:alkylhydroperoxidase family enzyme
VCTLVWVAREYDALIECLREAARPDRPVPEPFRAYVDTVRRHAYLVTDADVEALKAAGYDEDAIFEQTVGAAVAAGLDRRDAALRTLR